MLVLLLVFAAALVEGNRTWHMGFGPMSPQPTAASVLQSLAVWSKRSDAMLWHVDIPWAALLNGTSPKDLILSSQNPLIAFARAKYNWTTFFVTLDVTDGLDRSQEAPALRALNRSITEPAVQSVYVQYALAMASIIKPTALGLCAESNLIRQAASPAVYGAVLKMTTAAAATLMFSQRLYVSVNVECAWGLLPPACSSFVGINQDLNDFQFAQTIGLSSYPYLVPKFASSPDQIPSDYYARLVAGRNSITLSVVEGGWTTAGVDGEKLQAEYIRQHAQRIIPATQNFDAWFQLLFADLDLKAYFPKGSPPSNLMPFVHLGLVNSDLSPKQALSMWDQVFTNATTLK